jgi:hypothetical protein
MATPMRLSLRAQPWPTGFAARTAVALGARSVHRINISVLTLGNTECSEDQAKFSLRRETINRGAGEAIPGSR